MVFCFPVEEEGEGGGGGGGGEAPSRDCWIHSRGPRLQSYFGLSLILVRWLLTLSVKVSRVRTVSSHRPCIIRMPTTMKLGRGGGRLKFFSLAEA